MKNFSPSPLLLSPLTTIFSCTTPIRTSYPFQTLLHSDTTADVSIVAHERWRRQSCSFDEGENGGDNDNDGGGGDGGNDDDDDGGDTWINLGNCGKTGMYGPDDRDCQKYYKTESTKYVCSGRKKSCISFIFRYDCYSICEKPP